MKVTNQLNQINGAYKHEIEIHYSEQETPEALNLLKKHSNYYIFSFLMPKLQHQGYYKIRKK